MADSKEGIVKQEADAGAGPTEYINLKVMAQDNSEVHFKIKKTTPMRKLIDAYCQRQGLTKGSVRFMFDGRNVTEESTPAMMDMEENDVIEVVNQQVGGA